MMPDFLKTISKFDVFGQTITLRMNKQNFYRTAFGGCVSLFLFLVMVFIFAQNFISFLNKENLTATVLTSFEEFPSLAVLDDRTFAFAIQIEQPDFITNPYFDILIQQQQIVRYQNGTQSQVSSKINLIPCSVDRFTTIFETYGINITTQYNNLQLDNFLCFDYNSTFSIQGTNSNSDFQYLQISIKECTSSKLCATDIERSKAVQQYGSFKLKLYTVNQILNPWNPDNQYLQIFIDDSFYLKFLPSNLFKSVDIYLKEYEVQNDLSLTPLSDIAVSSYYILDQSEIKEQIDFYQTVTSEIATLYLRKSPYKTIVQRSYLKLDELLSNLGGIQQIFFFFLGVLLSLYNRFQLLVELANKLYEFTLIQLQQERLQNQNLEQINQIMTDRQIPEDIRTHRATEIELEIQLMNTSKIKQKEKNISLKFQQQKQEQEPEVPEPSEEDKDSKLNRGMKFSRSASRYFKQSIFGNRRNEVIPENGLDYFKQQIIKIINRSQPIFLSFTMLINFITCYKCCYHKKHIQLMNKAIDQITDQIDLFNILMKLNEIEKLKEVIFTPEQLLMFNFTPKPMISLDLNTKTINRSYLEQRSKLDTEDAVPTKQDNQNPNHEAIVPIKRGMHLKADEKLYRDIYQVIFCAMQAYDEVLQDSEQNNINKQIIKKLGPEVQSIFKLSKLIDYQKQSKRPEKRKNQLLNI